MRALVQLLFLRAFLFVKTIPPLFFRNEDPERRIWGCSRAVCVRGFDLGPFWYFYGLGFFLCCD